jgi:hypothetical protein
MYSIFQLSIIIKHQKTTIMKRISLLLLIITSTIFTTQAGLKRVGYSGAQITSIDFTSLQLAHNDASTLAGDTIQVYPGYVISAFTQTKRLIIIGVGYLTTGTNANLNLNVLVTQNPVQIGNVVYDATSNAVSGSEYHGISLSFFIIGNIGTSINNITVQRCSMGSFSGAGGSVGTISNIKFKQCLTVSSGSAPGIILSNCLIENSILTSSQFFGNNSFKAGSTFYIKNCTAATLLTSGSTLSFGSFAILVENCFLQSRIISDYANTTFNNCFLTDLSQAPLVPAVTGSNNVFNVNADNGAVFVGYPTQGTFSNDGRFVLKAGSPAMGAGTGGVDCGVFGNINPYKLSGIPATPAFYKLSAPSTNTSTNPYQITFSVRSNN